MIFPIDQTTLKYFRIIVRKSDLQRGVNEQIMEIYNRLVSLAEIFGIRIEKLELKRYDGLIKNRDIAIRDSLNPEQANTILAHEMGHFFLHSGDLLHNPDEKAESEADHFGEYLLQLVSGNSWNPQAAAISICVYLEENKRG